MTTTPQGADPKAPEPKAPEPQVSEQEKQMAAAVKEAIAEIVTPQLAAQRDILKSFTVPKAEVKEEPKGTKAARIVRAMAKARLDGDPSWRHVAYVAEHTYKDTELAQKLAGGLEKQLQEGTGSLGGFLVPTEYSREIIELLRAAAVVRRAGARVVPMATNDLRMSRIDAASAAAYSAEGANIAKSAETFGQVVFAAKKLTAVVPISNDLIRDSSPDVDALVRDDLVQVLALREDLAFIRDDGTSNKPKGILNHVPAGNKKAQVGGAGATVAQIVTDLYDLIKFVQAANVPAVRRGWLFSTRTMIYLRKQRESGIWVFPEMAQGELLGYPFFVSNQIPENLGAGTNESEAYYGEFSEAMIGENLNLVIDVSTDGTYWDGSALQSAFNRDETILRAIARHDFQLRHTKSFGVLDTVLWGT